MTKPWRLLAAVLILIVCQNGCDNSPSVETTNPETQLTVQIQPLTDSEEICLSGTRSWSEMDNLSRDGWETEALHNRIKKQLKVIGHLLIAPEEATRETLVPHLAANFRCRELRPAELKPVMSDAAIVIERGELSKADDLPIMNAANLASAIQQLTGPLRGAQETRHQFKVFRVDKLDDYTETEQFLALSGQTADGFFEQHATWITRWKIAAHQKPKLLSIRVTRFEQIRAMGASKSLFSDCTESALGNNACFQEQILRGANHWFDRIQFRTMLNLFSMPGIAVGDVNGDGLEDLYLCQDPGIPNRLFLQNPDGTAREVSKEWGVDWIEDARSALLVDLDNDDDQDLIVAIHGNIVVAENISQTHFKVQTVLVSSINPLSMNAFDYDSDGRLDFYVSAYLPDDFLKESSGGTIGATRQSLVVHDANDGAPNSMFRNVIEPGKPWSFIDVTKEIGLDENNHRWTFAAVAEDYDNDGDQDLYLANDYGRDNLYRNDVGKDGKRRFVDISDAANIEDSAGGMGMTWADYDRDGYMDAFVSNMWSSAGQRVTNQRRFKKDEPESIRKRYQHLAAGNTLMRNGPDGRFQRRSIEAGVEMGRWAWGNRFFDLNNDGWEDLVVANGYMTTEDSGDL